MSEKNIPAEGELETVDDKELAEVSGGAPLPYFPWGQAHGNGQGHGGSTNGQGYGGGHGSNPQGRPPGGHTTNGQGYGGGRPGRRW